MTDKAEFVAELIAAFMGMAVVWGVILWSVKNVREDVKALDEKVSHVIEMRQWIRDKKIECINHERRIESLESERRIKIST